MFTKDHLTLLTSSILPQLTAKKATSKIILHAQDFSIANDKILLTSNANTYTVSDAKINDTYNFLTLTLSQPLEEGENYTLTIPFYGNLKPGLDGVYISNYINKKTKEKE